MNEPVATEPARLVIKRSHVDRIKDEGEMAYPEECCGFLLGHLEGDRCDVKNVQPVPNAQGENRPRRFLISPEQFTAAEEFARQCGLEVVGFYHSHPDHPPVPSEFDREHALPVYAYAILSVMDGQAAGLRSFRLKDDRSGYDEDVVVCRI